MRTKIFSLPELQLKAMFHVKHYADDGEVDDDVSRETSATPTIVVVAGGRAPQLEWLKSASAQNSVYAADRGVACCLAAGIVPTELYGDCDSTTNEIYQEAERSGTQIKRFNPAKDDTDLQLLLKNLPSGDILATGIWGGRFDHLYSNVYTLLGMKQERKCQVLMADEQEFMLLLTAEEAVELKLQVKAEAISLLPLSAKTCVDFSGVRWPLEKASLQQLYPYAISNEVQAEKICCQCYSGALGLYIKFCG